MSSSETKECIICVEEVILSDFVKVTEQCDHENNMCRGCIRRYISERLDQGSINILCECRRALQEQDVKRFVSMEMFERYRILSVSHPAETKDKKFRSTKKFAVLLWKKVISRSKAEIKLIEAEIKTSAYMRSLKRCPKCKNKIQKDGGCDRMVCRCGYVFCWSCLADYDPIQLNGNKMHKKTCKHYA